jgi:hypothetical protein
MHNLSAKDFEKMDKNIHKTNNDPPDAKKDFLVIAPAVSKFVSF